MGTRIGRYYGEVSTYSVEVLRTSPVKHTATVKILDVLDGPGTIPVNATVTVPWRAVEVLTS